jgi:hypothetical protein
MATVGISRWCCNGGRQRCRATGWGWRAAVMRDVTSVQQRWCVRTRQGRRRRFWTAREGWAAATRRLTNPVGGGVWVRVCLVELSPWTKFRITYAENQQPKGKWNPALSNPNNYRGGKAVCCLVAGRGFNTCGRTFFYFSIKFTNEMLGQTPVLGQLEWMSHAHCDGSVWCWASNKYIKIAHLVVD